MEWKSALAVPRPRRVGDLRRLLLGCALAPLALLLTSCPALDARSVSGVLAPATVPASVIAHLLIVEATVAGAGKLNFLLDTGSSLTLISPRVAAALPESGWRREASQVTRVRTPSGAEIELARTIVPELTLDRASFSYVPAAVYDFTELSHQLGVRIDGIVGYPLFREVLLTVDYPRRRVTVAPHAPLDPQAPGVTAVYDDGGFPLAAVSLAGQSLTAVIDTGSDGAIAIDPAAAARAEFLTAPRPGALRASLSGDRAQRVGRIATGAQIGGHEITRPIVEIAEGVPSVGGEVLRHFALTFDQRSNLISWQRPDTGPIELPGRRSVGLSFRRGAAEWEIAHVIPGTPAAGLPLAMGDACVRINGEPTATWPIERYQQLLRDADVVTFTFLSGSGEKDVQLPVVDLVP